MSDDEETRDEIEDIVNNEPAEEVVIEAVIKDVKPVAKAKPKATKPNTK